MCVIVSPVSHLCTTWIFWSTKQ